MQYNPYIKRVAVERWAFAVLVVGHIDMEKYSCVTTDIATDEVILTEERIAKLDAIGMRWENSNPKRSSRQATQAETVTAKAG